MNIFLKENGKWKLFENVSMEELEKRNIIIGKDVYIGNKASIGYEVSIGNKARIEKDVYIGDNVYIGDRASIGNGAYIGYDVGIGNGANIGKDVNIGDGASIRYETSIKNKARITTIISKYNCNSYFDLNTNKKHIRIGCEIHSEEEWTEELQQELTIKHNDLKWWNKEGKKIFNFLKEL
jgi:UDP-3-O-[3-hydroxymyristoyl] glucosamine N-acyltransferase